MKKIVINPVTRTNNSCSVEVTVENKKIVDARCSGIFFRGFELIMRGRDPRDASYLTMRICGICPILHATAASYALENAAGVRPPRNGNLLRNMIMAANFLHNHIRHFYLYSLIDYARGPGIGPFIPCYTRDYRLPEKVNDSMIGHYFQALEISRLGQEMTTLLGGKSPFSQGVLAGGSTVPPSADVLMDFRFKLKRVNDFIQNVMLPDALTLGEYYPEYFEIGARDLNFMDYGLFPKSEEDRERYFPAGAITGGCPERLDSGQIREHINNSWYSGEIEPEHPSKGQTVPDREKEGAYSWVKAPRYAGKAVEGGALARLWIRGDYRRGISVMDRVVARAMEAGIIGKLTEEWIEELLPGEPVFNSFEVPREAEGVGLTGAHRGPLGHWLRIENGRIAHYEIITPTAWNFSPRDGAGQLGPVEEALIGTPVEDENEPVEIGRLIRSFDLCSSCATHVIIPGRPVKNMVILS